MQTRRNSLGAAAVFLLALLTVLYRVSPTTAINAQEPVALVETHVNAEDYVWDSADVTRITLDGAAITVDGTGATAAGSTLTITAAGNYHISGALVDGQIVVDTDDEAIVRLILDGVNISSSTSAPIYIANAEEVLIVLADASQNVLADASSYVFPTPEDDEPNAALFSAADLTIYGSGALTVTGNYNDGIASKDGLVIASGTITVTAVDDGIRGKDYLVVESGTLNITAGGDGLKSDNDEDAGTGYIAVAAGVVNVTAGGDALTAENSVVISAGDFTLTSGGGSAAVIDADLSAKGIKAGVSARIDGGTFAINAADDALHSNADIIINAGTFTLATGDDGIHADATLTINDGSIAITRSYEGLESAVITLNGGNIAVVASDDGVNVAGGTDGSGMGGFGRGGRDQFAVTATDYYLYINGGYLVVDAAGDGLDANGAIEMTGGTVIVNGPTESMNGALDYDAWFTMTGGWLVTAGSAGMAQAPGATSTQAALLLNLNAMQAAGTLVHLQASDGTGILTFAPSKSYQSITFSSPELTRGASYEVYLGGAADGAAVDGVYTGGTYSGGTLYTSFTASDMITLIGGGGMGGRGFGRP